MVEVAGEHPVAARQSGPRPRRGALEDHRRDAVPEPRLRRLGDVVKKPRMDDLVVGAALAEDARGICLRQC